MSLLSFVSYESCRKESQCLDAIADKNHDKVLQLLPYLKRHNIMKYQKWLPIVAYTYTTWLWKFLPNDAPLLHICALLGWMTIVKLLVTTYNCSPLQKDSHNGYIPLHYAALGGHLDVVQYFIQECNVDPMSRGSGFNILPLHFAAYLGETVFKCSLINKELKLLTVKYLIEQCRCDPMARDSYKRTALHWGAIGGGIDIVRYLTNDCHCDTMSIDTRGHTSVHYALLGNHPAIVAYLKHDEDYRPNKYNFPPLCEAIQIRDLSLFRNLIENLNHDPMCIDGDSGYTPLHIACKEGYVPVVQYLLSIPTVNPVARDVDHKTPLMVAADNGQLDAVAPIFEQFGKVRITHSVGSFVNIFLLGAPKAGKTTLTQVIKDRAATFFNIGTVRHVKSSTAGIVPTRLTNTELGNVILHDFAGQPQYYSSHTAVLENLLLNSGAVFLLLINLTEDVLKQVRFWWSIILNEGSKISSECHLIIIGSHIDEANGDGQTKLAQLSNFVAKEMIASNINVVGMFTLNCCKRYGNNLKDVLTELTKACASVRHIKRKQVSLSSNFLYEILDKNASTKNIYTLPELKVLCEQERQQGIVLPEDIIPLLTDLHAAGLIVYLENYIDYTKSWVLVHKEVLLAEVNGVLFAPEEFTEHRDIASNTGIVTSTALATLFPHYSLDMLIPFLHFMQLCEVLDASLLDTSNFTLHKKAESSTSDKILFFPALIQEKRPLQIKEHFKIGWCLKCEPGEFFSIRFLHILLLQLAYQYALPVPNAASHLKRQCSVWINGIYWINTDGVKVLVEQLEEDQCVVMLMSCHSHAEHHMMKLHCELLQKIVSLQQQYSPILHCTEYLIEPSQLHYPFDHPSTLRCFYMEQLISCIEEGKSAVVQTDGLDSAAISTLLPIEAKKYLLLLQSGSLSQNDEEIKCSDTLKSIIQKQYHQRKKNTLDISDLNNILESVKEISDWKELGLKLGLNYVTLEEIDEEQRGRPRKCKREMLAAWLRGEDNVKNQNWSALLNAVDKVYSTSSQKRRHN